MFSQRQFAVLCVFLLAALSSCKAAHEEYYRALAKVGIEKRELLVHRVDKAKESEADAQKQFKDALEQFQALVGHQGGDLEKKYDKLSAEYDDSQKQADEVKDRIRKVEEVANSLFDEWKREIGEYQNPDYRAQSERELRETKQRYTQLLSAMQRAAASMDPVLLKFRDQVLFLKHNLNARALGSLKGTADTLQGDVTRLVDQMQASITEAEGFIRDMKAAPTQTP